VAKPKLGRGLDALFSSASDMVSNQQPAQTPEAQGSSLVPIESIMPNPRQPRKAFNDDDPKLKELSASIKEHGLIQPIVVTRLESLDKSRSLIAEQSSSDSSWFGDQDIPPSSPSTGANHVIQYQIIAGERRWRASRMAGLTKVPVIIMDVTPQKMLELALIENIQRADLNPVEEALAYQALIQEFDLTQDIVAERVGKDRSTISNSLRLLQLAPQVRQKLVDSSEQFTEGHARALIGIKDEDAQVEAMKRIIALRMNVRQAEELVARLKAQEDLDTAIQNVAAPTRPSADLELEEDFRNALMVKVDLKQNVKGKGTLVLHFNSQDELESLYSRLVKREE
jgi:ParB family transcriptional regulator, chromosome partitioning protein